MGEIIRVVALDVDGCLTPGEAQPVDVGLLSYIGELNEHSRSDALIPAVTLMTGRSGQYVELMVQLTRGYLPAIYEQGAAALLPADYRFVYSPYLKPQASEHIRRALDLLRKEMGQGQQAHFQPGLELTISAYPLGPLTIGELGERIEALLEPYRDTVRVGRARTCVDITPEGMSKETGLRWLSQLTEVPMSAMAGIGDSANDLSFLELVGFSGAPANADSSVKQAVDYVSPHAAEEGVRDFLECCLARNRQQVR